MQCIFIFSLNNKPEIWSKYNWTKITTIVMVGYVSPEVMCFAHKHGVRAVIINSFPTNQLTNATARSDWVQTQLKLVTDNYLDGINIDYEDAIPQSMPQQKLGLTQLVTVDVAWSPRCIDSRCYDYAGISNYTDFIFVMSYDEQSQIFGPCVAGANSGYYKTRQVNNENENYVLDNNNAAKYTTQHLRHTASDCDKCLHTQYANLSSSVKLIDCMTVCTERFQVK
ncbi:hypothetical protein KUTeg_021803 [Tegillarca granosa]|uniref:GH18 domain-containing protein n=1 Tax=Tegillarca granosa TaxID=220873 RepID=A0ABQ9E7H4_TEGGR|nr:hypothetical protein KUTeg_021803 [Tegillarca granosa]